MRGAKIGIFGLEVLPDQVRLLIEADRNLERTKHRSRSKDGLRGLRREGLVEPAARFLSLRVLLRFASMTGALRCSEAVNVSETHCRIIEQTPDADASVRRAEQARRCA